MANTLPQGRTGGRRKKLTTENHERIINAVKAGATFLSAAGAAGINESTLYRWLREAEDPNSPAWVRQFREDLYRARDELEVRLVAGSVVRAAMGGYVIRRTRRTLANGTVEEDEQVAPADGRVGLEILARRFHDRGWGRQATEVTGQNGGPIQVQHSAISALAQRLETELAGTVIEGAVETSGYADEGDE